GAVGGVAAGAFAVGALRWRFARRARVAHFAARADVGAGLAVAARVAAPRAIAVGAGLLQTGVAAADARTERVVRRVEVARGEGAGEPCRGEEGALHGHAPARAALRGAKSHDTDGGASAASRYQSRAPTASAAPVATSAMPMVCCCEPWSRSPM